MRDGDKYQRDIIPIGDPNDAFAEFFVGQSYLAPVSIEQIFIVNVNLELGCRRHWYGAAMNTWLSHLAIEIGAKGPAANGWSLFQMKIIAN